VSDRRTWIVRAAILGSIALTGAAVVGAVLERLEAMSAPVPTVRGLRLGLTPDEVRAQRTGGEWTTRAEASGDLTLERAGERYEFHEGLLVAATVDLATHDPESAGPARLLSPGSVLVRQPTGSGVRLRLVSRDCPTHAEEARRLATDP
jgi:hypothetical protein